MLLLMTTTDFCRCFSQEILHRVRRESTTSQALGADGCPIPRKRPSQLFVPESWVSSRRRRGCGPAAAVSATVVGGGNAPSLLPPLTDAAGNNSSAAIYHPVTPGGLDAELQASIESAFGGDKSPSRADAGAGPRLTLPPIVNSQQPPPDLPPFSLACLTSTSATVDRDAHFSELAHQFGLSAVARNPELVYALSYLPELD